MRELSPKNISFTVKMLTIQKIMGPYVTVTRMKWNKFPLTKKKLN
jgi:hypothetical protein